MSWAPSSLPMRSATTRCTKSLLPSHPLTHSLRKQSSTATGRTPYQRCRDAFALLTSSPPGGKDSRRVEIIAHVRSVRTQKKRAFVTLGDGSTIQTVQALLTPGDASKLSTGTAVRVQGLWQPCPPSKEQTHELVAEEVEIVGSSDPETYPIRKQYLTPEYLRTLPHLRVRTPSNALLARLRSEAEYHAATFFRDNAYVRLQPPAITSSDCEGAGEVFQVRPRDKVTSAYQPGNAQRDSRGEAGEAAEFFRAPKYLTVSNQLHLEAFVHEHQRVWSLAPTFRAERSDTPRHLSEFYMLEGELRCASLAEVMDVVEGLVRSLAVCVFDSRIGKELIVSGSRENDQPAESRAKLLMDRVDGLRRSFWPRVTYTNAIRLLKQAANENSDLFSFVPNWEKGLQLEHEKYIAATVGNGSPVFVTNYPEHVKPFYMLPSLATTSLFPSDRSSSPEAVAQRWTAHSLPPPSLREEEIEQLHPTVSCFDLLLPDVGELVGGSLREHRYDVLQRSMQRHGLEGLDWYLELRRYGSVPHGGFGLGFDRLLMYLSGVDSVRDVVQWPRYYGRCDA